MQVYDFNVTNVAPQEIGAAGRYLKYLTGNAGGADATLKVQGGRNGETAILMPGQALTWPKGWGSFTLAANAAGSTIVGKVLIGDGKMDDSTVQGTVQVVDGGKARSLNGSAYAAAQNCSIVAGTNATTQLWNPVGSGVRMVVSKLYLASSTAQLLRIGFNTAALGGTVFYTSPKMTGGPASIIQQMTGNPVGIPTGFVYWLQANVQASQTLVVELREPYVITPGWGLCVQGNNLATDLSANIEYTQEANV